MQGRMHTLRRIVSLRMMERDFSFLITKNILQLLHNFIFELRALIGMECLEWSKDTKCSFDKSFCNCPLFLVRECSEHSKSS